MDVSHKLLRLFLPIVIIGALGIGILDSILTTSPVLAHRHVDEDLCVVDGRLENCLEGIDQDSFYSKTIGLLFFGALFALSLYSTVEEIRKIKKGERFDPKTGEPQSLYLGFFNKGEWFSYVGCIFFGVIIICLMIFW